MNAENLFQTFEAQDNLVCRKEREAGQYFAPHRNCHDYTLDLYQ